MPFSPSDRKAELVRRGVRQATIGRRVGHSRAYVNQVISGRRRSKRIEAAVAEALGLPVAEVFPPAPTKDDAEQDAGPVAA